MKPSLHLLTALALGRETERFLESENGDPIKVEHQPDERTQKPRHPKSRLNRLMIFSDEILSDSFSTWKQQDKTKKNFQRIGTSMSKAFDRCGFYEGTAEDPGFPTDPDADEDDDDTRSVDRYDRTDACKATMQLTNGFRKWADRHIQNCNGQSQHNHIEKKMKRLQKKMLKALERSGKCIPGENFDKPESGKVIKTFDELGPNWDLKFSLKAKKRSSQWTNILYSTSGSLKKLEKADLEVVDQWGDIKYDAEYPELNRVPAIFFKPGTLDLYVCFEHVKWEHVNGNPLQRCFSSDDTDSWNELKVNEWYDVEISSDCFDDSYDYYSYSSYSSSYYYYWRSGRNRRSHTGPTSGCSVSVKIQGKDNDFTYTRILGDRPDAFQRHQNVAVYGPMPENDHFKAAKVEIADFEFVSHDWQYR